LDTQHFLPLHDESATQLSHSIKTEQEPIIDNDINTSKAIVEQSEYTEQLQEEQNIDHATDETEDDNTLKECLQNGPIEEKTLPDHEVEAVEVESPAFEGNSNTTHSDSIVSSETSVSTNAVLEVSDKVIQIMETIEIDQIEEPNTILLEFQQEETLTGEHDIGMDVESPAQASSDDIASVPTENVETDNQTSQIVEDACPNETEGAALGEGRCEYEQQVVPQADISESSTEDEDPESSQVETLTSNTEEPEELPEQSLDTTISLSVACKIANSPVSNEVSISVASSPVAKLVQPVEADPPTPTLEDVTATITLSSLAQLEDDKAILRSFLDRAAASKENKAAMARLDGDNYSRRESLQNRRDSDAIRQALASPRQPLEHKDGNTFSPRKLTQSESLGSPIVKKPIDESTDPERILPPIDDLLPKPTGKTSPRRSGRSRVHKSAQTSNGLLSDRRQIAVRRNDGNDTINLTKTDAQILALETRRNTRKNKGSSLSVQDRLLKWRAELVVLGKDGVTPEPKALQDDQKGVRWGQTLKFLNEVTGMSEEAPLLDNSQPSKADPLALDPMLVASSSSESDAAQGSRPKRASRQQTPKIRRMRGLGVANGTPSKGVLAATLLPDELAEGLDDISTVSQPTERTTTVTVAAIASSVVKSNKSRIQPPTKLNLNPSIKSVSSGTSDAKEDAKKLSQIKKPTVVAVARKQVSMLPVAGANIANKRGTRKLV
jgi:hypothetical protein